MSLLASLAACVSISVDGRTALWNVWIKLGAQEWGDKNSTDQLNEAVEAHAPDYHPMPADTDIKMGNWPGIIALLKALELSLFRYEERLGKQRDYDLESKLMEEPVRSAETASHVETIEARKALATNRDFPTDMRSLSYRLLDTPVYAVSYNRAGLGLRM
eukprot:jgi/Tetstr1/459170/TSEL_004616.t1